ncbi:MAG: ABC transporter substrate-binding protein [Gaiella sp.]
MRRLVLAAALAALGTMLAAAGSLAGSTEDAAKRGGTLRVNYSTSDFGSLDPAIAYDGPSWTLLYVTGSTLVAYADAPAPKGATVVPDAAATLPRVSRDGRTYTFTLRKGLRFSDGSRVTAAAFARALLRAVHPDQRSPAGQFLGDVVGADAVEAGKAAAISGVRARGLTLTIRLQRPRPTFLAELALPFFQAVKPSMPIDAKGIDVYPSAGPYRIASRDVGRTVVVERNRSYTGPRTGNLDRIVVTVNTDTNASLLQVRSGEADYDLAGLPPSAHASLAEEFGVRREGKGRYFVNPTLALTYVALNTSRPFFANVAARKAVNWAVDRPALLRVGGKFAGARTDQILPKTMPGFLPASIYPIKGADPAAARRLAPGLKGEVILLHTTSPTSVARAQVLKYNLERLGISVKLDPRPFAVALKTAETRGAEFDMFLSSWGSDYPDPSNFVNPLLDGATIQEQNNTNFSYVDDDRFNQRMRAVARLTGDDRYSAYGKLDVDIMRQLAPWIPILNPNVREFVSARVTGYVFQPVFQAPNLALLAVR